jgi:large repetitive protein
MKQTSKRLYGLLLGLSLYASTAVGQTAGTFAATGSMTTARIGHTATLLVDGRVLIAGGGSAMVELYDPSTGSFTAIGSMTASEGVGSATLLPDGRVLLIETKGAELYDPSTGTFSATGNMIEVQNGYTATLLTNGKVLVTGGTNGQSDCCANVANPELYDPLTQMFSLAGPYADTGAPTVGATYGAGTSGLVSVPASLLPGGKVLISSESAAELYDPLRNAFGLTGSMTAPYLFLGPTKPTSIYGRAATLLPNGKVLVTGGAPAFFDTGDLQNLNRAELYDPSRGTFTATGNMALIRYSHASTLLPDGTVLITGGIVDNFLGTNPMAELYNPVTGAFLVAGNMKSGRSNHQATLLNDGRVLITGGSFSNAYQNEQLHASAELYTPSVLVPAPALLSLSGDGKGQGAIQHAGTYRIASATDPAVAGEYLSIYLTGLEDGSVIPPQVGVGGRLAEITFFGNVPGYPGLNVINVRMPSGVAPGSAVPVRLTYLGRPSNEVTIGVQ